MPGLAGTSAGLLPNASMPPVGMGFLEEEETVRMARGAARNGMRALVGLAKKMVSNWTSGQCALKLCDQGQLKVGSIPRKAEKAVDRTAEAMLDLRTASG